jgi:hypothetical protein
MNKPRGKSLLIEAGFWKPGPLKLHDGSRDHLVTLDEGECYGACFEPGGRRVAYCQNGGLYVINNDGSGKRRISFVVAPAYLNWIADGHIVFCSRFDRAVYRISPEQPIRELVFISHHHSLANFSIAQSGKECAWSSAVYVHGEKPTYKVVAWNLVTPRMPEPELGAGFAASVSSDGRFIARSLDGHREVVLYYSSDLQEAGRILTGDEKINAVRFSQHSPHHLVYTLLDSRIAHVYDLRTQTGLSIGPGVITDYFPGAQD